MDNSMIGRFPGLGCAYSDAAGKITAEYYGYSDKEKNIPVDENTVFPACSISKFVTAMCLMILNERKAIDIDAPVNDYLSKWKLLTAEGKESGAPVRSLMCHTSGIVDGDDAFYGLRRSDPEISLTDILEGGTAYNNRPAREEKPHGTAFEYSDAGYCVLQMLIQEVTRQPFDKTAQGLIFDRLDLKNAFFASPENAARFEKNKTMAACYDSGGAPIPGRFPQVPDLAASGLWCSPTDLAAIAKEYIAAYNGRNAVLRKKSAREMAKPAEGFAWTGLGIFIDGKDALVSRGWGENGQCILKINCRTEEISAVMTNCDPGADQAESGIERLADRKF